MQKRNTPVRGFEIAEDFRALEGIKYHYTEKHVFKKETRLSLIDGRNPKGKRTGPVNQGWRALVMTSSKRGGDRAGPGPAVSQKGALPGREKVAIALKGFRR